VKVRAKMATVADLTLQQAAKLVSGCERRGANADDEWYTPPEIIELVRTVLGEIDLDPASCIEAQRTVMAKRFYTKHNDGLRQKWLGRVFLTPPYSNLVPWTDKLLQSYKSGEVKEAILLMNSETDTGWFHRVVRESSVCCFVEGRLKFRHRGRAAIKPASQGQAIFYFGRDPDKFMRVFAKVGAFAITVSPTPVIMMEAAE
jgi:ParB family chromosome partitioning protein